MKMALDHTALRLEGMTDGLKRSHFALKGVIID